MMARKQEYIRWAITGECGLYTGQYLTKRDAIADHVHCLNRDVSGYADNCLDSEQLAAWHRCYEKGDRAVKVKIIIQMQRT